MKRHRRVPEDEFPDDAAAAGPDAGSAGPREDAGDASGIPQPRPEGPDPAGGPGSRGAPRPPDPEILAQDYLDQLQRLKAEFDNYRRRTAKEREDWFIQSQADLIAALLPVLDDLHRAREHEAADAAAETEGMRLILRRFEDTLERLGLERQGAEAGVEFDPDLHDAVMAVPSDEIPEGKIIRVIEPGYLFRGRLLRRSRICYSTGPAGE